MSCGGDTETNANRRAARAAAGAVPTREARESTVCARSPSRNRLAGTPSLLPGRPARRPGRLSVRQPHRKLGGTGVRGSYPRLEETAVAVRASRAVEVALAVVRAMTAAGVTARETDLVWVGDEYGHGGPVQRDDRDRLHDAAVRPGGGLAVDKQVGLMGYRGRRAGGRKSRSSSVAAGIELRYRTSGADLSHSAYISWLSRSQVSVAGRAAAYILWFSRSGVFIAGCLSRSHPAAQSWHKSVPGVPAAFGHRSNRNNMFVQTQSAGLVPVAGVSYAGVTLSGRG